MKAGSLYLTLIIVTLQAESILAWRDTYYGTPHGSKYYHGFGALITKMRQQDCLPELKKAIDSTANIPPADQPKKVAEFLLKEIDDDLDSCDNYANYVSFMEKYEESIESMECMIMARSIFEYIEELEDGIKESEKVTLETQYSKDLVSFKLKCLKLSLSN